MIRYRYYTYLIFIVPIFCLISCSSAFYNPSSLQLGVVKDLIIYPQDLKVYASVLPSCALISEKRSTSEYLRFKKHFFQPWNATKVSVSVDTLRYIFTCPNTKNRIRWWAENLLPWTESDWKAIERNATCSTYPSCMERGILIERVSVRAAPTSLPFFLNPSLAGEGFPFDYLAVSNLHLGMPVLVAHTSADGAWFFIETALVSGWIPKRAVATVGPSLIEKVVSLPQAVIIHDYIPLREINGHFVGLGFLGTVLPIEKIKSHTYIVLVPVDDQYGNAHFVNVEISKSDAMLMPQVLTADHIATLGNPLIGTHYGWGGNFGLRDCSELMKDLFIPFGIWLPKNSRSQIHAWNFIELENCSREEYHNIMKTQAIPFATLIGCKGHLGLYLGMYNDVPVMLHNFWGVRVYEKKKKSRHVLGRTIITSLDVGSELDTYELLFDLKLGISVLQ